MSHSTTKQNHEPAATYTTKAGNGTHKADEKVKPEMLLALLATDWCHGDRHFAAQIQEMARKLLGELGGVNAKGEPPAEPNDEQAVALEARARLEGAANLTSASPAPVGPQPAHPVTQPARTQDEQRMAH